MILFSAVTMLQINNRHITSHGWTKTKYHHTITHKAVRSNVPTQLALTQLRQRTTHPVLLVSSALPLRVGNFRKLLFGPLVTKPQYRTRYRSLFLKISKICYKHLWPDTNIYLKKERVEPFQKTTAKHTFKHSINWPRTQLLLLFKTLHKRIYYGGKCLQCQCGNACHRKRIQTAK